MAEGGVLQRLLELTKYSIIKVKWCLVIFNNSITFFYLCAGKEDVTGEWLSVD